MHRNHVAEVLFLDPAVPDRATLLRGLRPGIEVVALRPDRAAARQMAEALAGRAGLAAIHVVAHGEAGHVDLCGGAWSAGSVARQAGELGALGRALAPGGEIRLWSCRAGAGAAGAALGAPWPRPRARRSRSPSGWSAPPRRAAPGPCRAAARRR
ncbi:MAG: DUF4347 domain-containing protein [Dongiaceae bacterium]